MSGLSEEPQFERVPQWALPTDKAGFLAWLNVAVPGTDKVSTFLTYPAAEHMPSSLRLELTGVTKYSDTQERVPAGSPRGRRVW